MTKIMRVTAEVDLDRVLDVARRVGAVASDTVTVQLSVLYLGVPMHCDTLDDIAAMVRFAIDHQNKISDPPMEAIGSGS